MKDTTLSVLCKIISEGWPEKRSECPAYLHPYWNYRDELTVSNGMILKGSRIVIPRFLQTEVLQQLHYAHQGAEKCKLRAKGSIFWANINRDIEEMVKSCSPCQHQQNLNTKEPLVSHDVPSRLWHADYLLVTDYYSKFPAIRKLPNLQSSTVVANLKAIFEEHGIPTMAHSIPHLPFRNLVVRMVLHTLHQVLCTLNLMVLVKEQYRR
ncbi:Retrovirus-related Pol poly from transposon [Paramuricea clavata]|uniref:Retrovirus-related Pol poly from transposon, partial n=1 Tax=Paramuricea clavata TaxID=317549 RepID=A0A7D9DQG7_PARCT|nr:Retrovirus-related Pol poly from transposon [Paramuricea clavata]